ncbi:MAG: hypothetical protein LH654_02975 [Thermoleophilia bacterium]|nr:hypothetical protein [Thermoleophilia bacterium]
MRTVSFLLLAAAAATLLSASALAQSERSLSTPGNLKPFLLKASEASIHEFSRTPSFSWKPVRGAVRYEFQVAKNISFNESSVFYATGSVRSPAVAIPLALPWMSGKPFAAYARVRAVNGDGKVSPWSAPYGFNLRWKDIPQQLPEYPGLSRWTPVEGATGYEVWFTNIGGYEKHVTMRTNSVDHREAYTFHDSPTWTSSVKWRVRAIRNGEEIVHLNGLPAVYYGPWSPEYTSNNPPQSGPLQVVAAVTNGATSKPGEAHAHELTPGLAFRGREALNNFGGTFGLYRVYISTDSDCVNVIFKGSIVGSPAFSPRTSGPLKLPIETTKELPKALAEVLPDGDEANTFMAGVVPVIATEQAPADKETAAPKSSGSTTGVTPASPAVATPKAVDLPESGWPNGRFYWTVVPVRMVIVDDGKKIEYHETRPAQDNCQSGNVIEFGKDSSPVVAGEGTAYASGLSPSGRLVAATGTKNTFYGRPLVAWRPVQGASGYEVQWSHNRDRWRTRGSLETEATAVTLPLDPGAWWYRVRARNPYLPGHVKRMAWSTPLSITVAKPKFRLASSK